MVDRQERAGMHTYKPGKREFSISWPSREEGDGNDDKRAKENSIEDENNGKEHKVTMGQATWS
jgi:hypothetical protein